MENKEQQFGSDAARFANVPGKFPAPNLEQFLKETEVKAMNIVYQLDDDAGLDSAWRTQHNDNRIDFVWKILKEISTQAHLLGKEEGKAEERKRIVEEIKKQIPIYDESKFDALIRVAQTDYTLRSVIEIACRGRQKTALSAIINLIEKQ